MSDPDKLRRGKVTYYTGRDEMDFGALMFFTDYAISAVELARAALEERGFE